MALPKSMQTTFRAEEIEFIAETVEHVSIMPLYALEATRTLGGVIGPLRPREVATVPLWLATSLKKMRRCQIHPPPWLTVANLEEQLKNETTLPEFSSLPLRYMEVAHTLLERASDDIPDADRLRGLLKDLREARQAKSRLTADLLASGDFSVHLSITGISVMEFNELRPFFSLAARRLIALDPAEEERREQDVHHSKEEDDRTIDDGSLAGWEMND